MIPKRRERKWKNDKKTMTNNNGNDIEGNYVRRASFPSRSMSCNESISIAFEVCHSPNRDHQKQLRNWSDESSSKIRAMMMKTSVRAAATND